MVLPGNNISQSEVHSQVGRKHKHPYCQQSLDVWKALFSKAKIKVKVQYTLFFQAEVQFNKMDQDQDGVVSKQEFLAYCYNNPTVIQSMCVLP